jgi:hypothetical protein
VQDAQLSFLAVEMEISRLVKINLSPFLLKCKQTCQETCQRMLGLVLPTKNPKNSQNSGKIFRLQKIKIPLVFK